MINNIALEKRAKVELLENMLAVALVDGTFEEAEKNYLTHRAQEYGFSSQEVDTFLTSSAWLQNSIVKQEQSHSQPTTLLYKEEMLADAVFMSLSNGEMDPKEYALCIRLAEKLGMDKSDLDEVITYVGIVYTKLG